MRDPELASKIAESLLKIKAVRLSPEEPFTWSSGWKSPIYCDNRLTLSFPEVRREICDAFVEIIRSEYPQTEGIAGVATGAIAPGVLVADALGLPFVYIRAKAKGHGMQNLVEGDLNQADKYVVIEDLISTGGSSVAAVDAMKKAGAEVIQTLAIFSYGFPQSRRAFADADCNYSTLTDLESLLERAVEFSYLEPPEVELVRQWQIEPESWSPPSHKVE